MLEYKVEDIFQDVPGDDKKVIMTIPEEIMEKQGWTEGTKIKVKWGDQGTIIIEEMKDNE
tara:strand:+ start:3275 stop:3454 length:180 start_codon:yes stop_codon:yes gene_type:complete